MNASLSIHVAAFRTGGWLVSTVRTPYDERGRQGRPVSLHSVVAEDEFVLQVVMDATKEVMHYHRESLARRRARQENASNPGGRLAEPTARERAYREGLPAGLELI